VLALFLKRERERLYSSDEEDWLQMGIDTHQSQYKCEQSISLCLFWWALYHSACYNLQLFCAAVMAVEVSCFQLLSVYARNMSELVLLLAAPPTFDQFGNHVLCGDVFSDHLQPQHLL
jgi:hypothetical protein